MDMDFMAKARKLVRKRERGTEIECVREREEAGREWACINQLTEIEWLWSV